MENEGQENPRQNDEAKHSSSIIASDIYRGGFDISLTRVNGLAGIKIDCILLSTVARCVSFSAHTNA